uniref:Uncharacterized protein n=1 Tax=viral metagenome TaxID=1070528 RepID=A0A6C0HMJ1_9ZZZZ
MHYNKINILFGLLAITLVMCLALMLLNNTRKTTLIGPNIIAESFENPTVAASSGDPVVDAIQAKLAASSPDQLQSTIKALQARLVDYGYAPQLNSYVKKTELSGDAGKCTVSRAEDRDKYITKSDLPPPGPRINLSEYVKKTSIPPEKVCPTMQDVDMSKYVLKSTLPPNQQCPACIAPKVKVSAGLCRECPPNPTCPPPQACPVLKCPEPQPCIQKECAKCDEIRYIKVPAVITKTIPEQRIEEPQPQERGFFDRMFTQNNSSSNDTQIQNNDMVKKRLRNDEINREIANATVNINAVIPTTTSAACVLNNSVPSTTLPCARSQVFVPNPELNSEFKRFGIYGPPQKYSNNHI